jgi:hypothetical protein
LLGENFELAHETFSAHLARTKFVFVFESCIVMLAEHAKFFSAHAQHAQTFLAHAQYAQTFV